MAGSQGLTQSREQQSKPLARENKQLVQGTKLPGSDLGSNKLASALVLNRPIKKGGLFHVTTWGEGQSGPVTTPPNPWGGGVLTCGLGLNRGQEAYMTKQSWSRCGPVHGGPILSAPICPARQCGLVVRPCDISSWESSLPSCCTSLQPSPFPSNHLIPWGPLFQCSDSPRGRGRAQRLFRISSLSGAKMVKSSMWFHRQNPFLPCHRI